MNMQISDTDLKYGSFLILYLVKMLHNFLLYINKFPKIPEIFNEHP